MRTDRRERDGAYARQVQFTGRSFRVAAPQISCGEKVRRGSGCLLVRLSPSSTRLAVPKEQERDPVGVYTRSSLVLSLRDV